MSDAVAWEAPGPQPREAGMDDMLNSRRLLLRDDDEKTPGIGLDTFATMVLGWPRRGECPEDRERCVHRTILWYDDPQTMVCYMEDLFSGTAFAMIMGLDRVLIQEIAELTELLVDTVRPSELLRAVDEATTPDNMAYALLRLGIGSPIEYDDAFFSRMADAMTNNSPRVREAAIWATTYNPWRASVEPLSRMADQEQDRDLALTARKAAEVLTSFFNTYGSGRP